MSTPVRRGAAGGGGRRPAGPPAPGPASPPADEMDVDDSAPAPEDPDADDLEAVNDEEEEGEDLLDEDNMMDDYKAIDELDRYEAEGLVNDDEISDAASLSPNALAEVNRKLRKRDREEEAKKNRKIGALDRALQEDEALEDEDGEPTRRVRRRIGEEGDDVELDEDGNPIAPREEEEELDDAQAREIFPLDEYDGPLNEWIALDKTRREIRRRIRNFLSNYKGKEEVAIYPGRIVAMGRENRCSLEVSFFHLSDAEPILAVWVADEPTLILEIFDEEATQFMFRLWPQYEKIQQEVHVRITLLPITDKIRDLRQHHLGCLIRVEGVVTRRTGVFPQLQIVVFNCTKCHVQCGPYTQNGTNESKPTRCPECQSTGPFIVNSTSTIYRNYQRITLQESPGSVPAGRVPRQKDVILLHDLIDSCTPGEMVDITGVYKHTFDPSLNTKNGFPVFQTILQANFVSKHAHAMASFRLTDEDKQEIITLSKNPRIADMVINSIGPSIYGHSDIKTALALAMFSGEPKQFENGHRIRGDINVLVLGDPGTAKSQFLKYAEKTSHRAVYTTGKGASAVGLTASVHRDALTREWTLEGGALVLADQGICLIDEFDKMNDQDRTSIHEAMEQQSISISKAGIITTLKARCSVIAAANPVMGRYDSSKTFAENVELTDAILSRFDILCVVRDTVDQNLDNKLATFVVNSHMKARDFNSQPSGPGVEDGEDHSLDLIEQELANDPASRPENRGKMIPQSILRKYIHYAREHCHPKLTHIDDDKISKLYAELRRESMVSGGIPIAVRHIESIIRMSEAHAKMHLRSVVVEEDVDVAIRVMLESFISSQKFAVMRTLRHQFEPYLTYKKDQFELLLFTLNSLVNDRLEYKRLQLNVDVLNSSHIKSIDVATDTFRARANELGISNIDAFLHSDLFKANSFSFDNAGKKRIIKTFQ